MEGPSMDQGGPSVNIYDFAAARAKRPKRAAAQENDSASYGKVYEIETARRARNARIPVSVYEEMEAAAAMFDELEEQGRQIRFSEVGGYVFASLCDSDGDVVRPMTLREVMGMDFDPETAA
jgi:hypothetical protein